jgi:putative DNA primase/helicase
MREDFWTFAPTHKIAQVTNHKPTVRGTDHAIWRRLRLIPFTVVIPEERQDKQLSEKLRAESAGILRWMLHGSIAWQSGGLADPPEVLTATKDYQNEQDLLGSFLDECCRTGPDYRAKASDLYSAYCTWCKCNDEKEAAQRTFGMALTERGFSRKRENDGYWWIGLALK